MGNPHCIIFTQDDSAYLARQYGPSIENHIFFPQKTNVEFVQIKDRSRIKLDVYERGCGITLACGTGACAATVAGILKNYLDDTVCVELPGGELTIEYKGKNVYMTGPAEKVFEGVYLLK